MADKWESFSEISVEVPSGETNSFDDTMDQGKWFKYDLIVLL
jgi:hypothetical protein